MFHKLVLAALTGALAVTAACSGTCAPEPPGDPFEKRAKARNVPLMRQDLEALAEEMREEVCKRPIVGGDPLPGSAHDDFKAVFELGDSEKGSECRSLLRHHEERLAEYEGEFVPPGETPDGFPLRDGFTLFKYPNIGDAGVVCQIEAACGDVLSAMLRAIQHEDLCGPSWPAVLKVDAGDTIPLQRFAHLETAKAFADGEFDVGCERALSALRFWQDAVRGYGIAALLSSMVARAKNVHLLERALHEKGVIPEKSLFYLDARLDQLIADRPPCRVVSQSMTLDEAWGLRRSVVVKKASPPRNREDDAMTWVSLRTAWLRSHAFLEMCPKSASEIDCLSALRRFEEKAAEWERRTENPAAMVVDMLGVLIPGALRRERYDEDLVYSAGPFVSRLMIHAETAFYLAALRILARYRVEAQREGACPGAEIFESYELSEAMVDPTSGDPIRAEESAPGKFVLRPSHDLFDGFGDAQKPAIFIDCPFDGFAHGAE